MDTWKTPFNELVMYGVKGTGLATSDGGSSSRQRSAGHAEEGHGQGEAQRQPRMTYAHSGAGSVSTQERMQTPASKPEMGEYFPVRQ
jgi:hypothetical protein